MRKGDKVMEKEYVFKGDGQFNYTIAVTTVSVCTGP